MHFCRFCCLGVGVAKVLTQPIVVDIAHYICSPILFHALCLHFQLRSFKACEATFGDCSLDQQFTSLDFVMARTCGAVSAGFRSCWCDEERTTNYRSDSDKSREFYLNDLERGCHPSWASSPSPESIGFTSPGRVKVLTSGSPNRGLAHAEANDAKAPER